MTGRLVVLPARSRIFRRSIGYGIGAGATTGALLAATSGLLASLMTVDGGGAFVLGVFVAAPIGAAVGAVVGVICGLTGGIGLVACRRHVVTSRGAIRAVAAAGAGLLPSTWLVAAAAQAGQRGLPVPTALTVVTAVLAAILGPHAFYGRTPRRRRRPSEPRQRRP